MGQNVLLNVTSTDKILMINWFRGEGTDTSISILTLNPISNFKPTPGKMFTGREEVMTDGSLKISNLSTSDTGIYTLELSIPDSFRTETFQLTVIGKQTEVCVGMDKACFFNIYICC